MRVLVYYIYSRERGHPERPWLWAQTTFRKFTARYQRQSRQELGYEVKVLEYPADADPPASTIGPEKMAYLIDAPLEGGS